MYVFFYRIFNSILRGDTELTGSEDASERLAAKFLRAKVKVKITEG